MLPLPDDVDDLLGVDEDGATGAVMLRLGRLCTPEWRLTVARDELRGRLLAAGTARAGENVDERLRRAVEMAPHQADLRIQLLLRLLAKGLSQEAERVLREGLRLTPFEVAWLARQQPSTTILITQLLGAEQRVDLRYRGDEQLPNGAAWCPSRRLAAFIDWTGTLRVSSAGNVEVFATGLVLGREFNDLGEEVLPRGRKAVAARVAAAEAMLGQLGFRTLSPHDRIAAENKDFLSWVRAKDRGISASGGDRIIRVRQRGKVVFEEKIDTMGLIRLDWGVLLPEENMLLLAWSRMSGSDDCPNGEGISQAPLPASLAAPNPASSLTPSSASPAQP